MEQNSCILCSVRTQREPAFSVLGKSAFFSQDIHALLVRFAGVDNDRHLQLISQTDLLSESFSLDMAMAGDSYFEAMYHNIDTIKEALG